MRPRLLFFYEDISPLNNKKIKKMCAKIIAEYISLNVLDCSPLDKNPREQYVPLMRL